MGGKNSSDFHVLRLSWRECYLESALKIGDYQVQRLKNVRHEGLDLEHHEEYLTG